MCSFSLISSSICSRAPQGARGLKFRACPVSAVTSMSRAPQGARGLKCIVKIVHAVAVGRAPQGARGLKFETLTAWEGAVRSRPARGAWIEIVRPVWIADHGTRVAPRKGRVD